VSIGIPVLRISSNCPGTIGVCTQESALRPREISCWEKVQPRFGIPFFAGELGAPVYRCAKEHAEGFVIRQIYYLYAQIMAVLGTEDWKPTVGSIPRKKKEVGVHTCAVPVCRCSTGSNILLFLQDPDMLEPPEKKDAYARTNKSD
jgi:hypothetical protein